MRTGGPPQASHDKHQFAVQHGIVTQNKDPENLNRIKVRLPFLDNGDTDQTHWAQLATPMEGDKFGWYTIPDINDQVIVMFIAGDISQPVIVGGTWSKTDNSPEPNEDGQNNFRGYRSRCGHRLILDDSKKTKIVIADKTTKNMLGLGNFEKDGTGPNKCAVYKPPMSGDKGMSFSSMEGTFEITAKAKLKIEAQQNIKMNAKTSVEIKAGGELKMEGQSVTKLTAGAPMNLDGAQVKIG